jgi:hypothetical protein
MWNYWFKYSKLFLSFTNLNISADKFVDEFITLRTSTFTEFNQLIQELINSFKPANKFQIDVRAFGFGSILSQTYEDCDVFVSDKILESIEENFRDIGKINENEFYNRIREATLTIQKQIDENI